MQEAVSTPDSEGERPDTVQFLCERAQRRARRVSEQCMRTVSTFRAPAPGPVEHVDPRRLARLHEAPRDVPNEDRYAQDLATRVGRWG